MSAVAIGVATAWFSRCADNFCKIGDNEIKSTFFQMPEEQLKAFWEAVQADARLQTKLRNVTDPAVVAEIAKAAGFVISADEFKSPHSDLTPDLTEEELEAITGGVMEGALAWGRRELGRGVPDGPIYFQV